MGSPEAPAERAYQADSGFRASEAAPPAPLPLMWHPYRQHLKAGAEIGPQPGQSDCIHFIEKGWACRSRTLANGKRQILALFLPGEHIGLRPLRVARSGDRVTCLSDCDLVSVPVAEVSAMIDTDHVFARRFETPTTRQLIELEEMVVSLGQRGAPERLAHLLSDLADRQHVRGSGAVKCELHLTQTGLSEVLGLSPVHVNRVIKLMKTSGLVQFSFRRFSVPDLAALRAAGGYEPIFAG